MRIHPVSQALMSLKGRKTAHGQPLPTKAEARRQLKAATGKDFGFNARKWGEWLRGHRQVYRTAGNGAGVRKYRYLAPNPKSFYRQLFVKGTRIRARALYGLHVNDEEPWTVEFIASQYDLPIEAVREAISYCESNPPELLDDYRREEAIMEATGMNEPDYKYHGKPKLLSAVEMARLSQ